MVLPNGETITAFNSVTASPDPTGHAEINAIRATATRLNTHDLSGLTLLTTGEPCPMCLTACLWARLDRVLYINTLEDARLAGFDDTHFYSQIRSGITDLHYDHYSHDDGSSIYEAWEGKADRIEY